MKPPDNNPPARSGALDVGRRAMQILLEVGDLPPEEQYAAAMRAAGGDAGVKRALAKMFAVEQETADQQGDAFVRHTSVFGASVPTESIEQRAERESRRLVGRVVDGKYRIDRPLGHGSMGLVFSVTHVGLGRPMALKLLWGDSIYTSDYQDRFRREARAIGSIQHQNVVLVSDFGVTETEGTYLVMELLEGCSLRGELDRRRRFPFEQAVEIAQQMFAGLDAAHEQRIVHRDVKPHNIFLAETTDGQVVKVLDFGVAKVPESADNAMKTRSGAIIGTPAYICPEQWAEKKLDARSDLYSAGIVLYEMLTGRLPFLGVTIFEIADQHLHEEPPRVETVVPEVPKALSDVCHRLLQKKPDARYQSARKAAEALCRAVGRQSGFGGGTGPLQPPTVGVRERGSRLLGWLRPRTRR